VRGNPCGLAIGGGGVWATDLGAALGGEPGDGHVTRIDVWSGRAGQQWKTGHDNPCKLAYGAGAVWVLEGDGATARERGTGRPLAHVVLPPETKFNPTGVSVTDDALWVAGGGRGLVRVDFRTHRVTRVSGLASPLGVAVGNGRVWALAQEDGDVAGIDARTLRTVVRAKVPEHNPGAIAVGLGSVWVAGQFGALYRIDPRNGQVVGRWRRVGGGVSALAVSHGALWALSEQDSAVWRVIPGERPRRVARLSGNPFGLVAGYGGIWVGTRANPPVSQA
jgi:hypothetical protein